MRAEPREETIERTSRERPREQAIVSKQPFVEPKLTFVEPKLVKRGKLTKITGFFGSFSP